MRRERRQRGGTPSRDDDGSKGFSEGLTIPPQLGKEMAGRKRSVPKISAAVLRRLREGVAEEKTVSHGIKTEWFAAGKGSS